MASQGGESRLAQMQMRIQQKQRQEKEQRKIDMTTTKLPLPRQEILNKTITVSTKDVATYKPTASNKKSSSIISVVNDSGIGAGKVRQMFNERRRAGIDKSNPLKPINTINPKKKIITSSDLIHQAIQNGGSDLDLSENTLYPYPRRAIADSLKSEKEISSTKTEYEDEPDKVTSVNKVGLSVKKSPDSLNNLKRGANIKLKPVITRKEPPRKNSITPTPKPDIAKKTPGVTSTKTKSLNNSAMASNKTLITPPRKSSTPPPGTVECRICKRFFNEDRIGKHEEICEKTGLKKRKPFDVTKHRVKGTDAEKYLSKKKLTSQTKSAAKPADPSGTKSNWRSKHEDFINAIRAAKGVQAHLAKGGKLSDLPPPPPSENADYIQCPHCQRRFNEAAANRHIPKCANMLHNKPKPGPQPKKR